MDNSWAAPGVWCECINDEWEHNFIDILLGLHPSWYPKVGDRLKILTVAVHPNNGQVGLVFSVDPDWGFEVEKFRPLSEVDRETFQRMLEPEPELA